MSLQQPSEDGQPAADTSAAGLDWEALTRRLRGARVLLDRYDAAGWLDDGIGPPVASVDHLAGALTCLTLRVIQFAETHRGATAPAVHLVPLSQVDAAILLAERIANSATPPEVIDQIIAEHGRRVRARRRTSH